MSPVATPPELEQPTVPAKPTEDHIPKISTPKTSETKLRKKSKSDPKMKDGKVSRQK
jgi:hypothetical protein